MPAPIDESIKRKVIQQWISGESRDTIAAENNVGTGTVSSIIANYKAGLETLDFDSIRQLSIEIRKQGLNWSDLASHFRLYNYFIKSGAAEEKIESFIDMVHSTDISPEKLIDLVNQLFNISKSECIPLDQVSGYIREKLEEKKKIEEELREVDTLLQNKNVSIQAINEHNQLNEKLNERGLSTEDIEKLLNLIENAKEYGFDAKKIIAKLRSIKRIEKKEERLRNNCEILSKQLIKYKEVIPLANIIWDLHIGRSELISFKIAVNEAVEIYGFPHSTAAFHVLNNLRDYNRVGALKKELSGLYLQKFVLNEFCSRHSQAIMALANLRSHGITEEQIITIKNFLEDNRYVIDMKSNSRVGSL
jgi:hypothetical protein